MRIKPDIKLDYKDVLLEPKRSDLTSRKDVAMEREFTFLHSQKTFHGIPIMASNTVSYTHLTLPTIYSV